MAEQLNFTQVRTASGLNILLGAWLIASPWIFRYGAAPRAFWNSILVGALILTFAVSRFSAPFAVPGLSWINAGLGLWTIASPWIYHYATNGDAFWDNVALGLAVAALAFWSGRATFAEATREHRPA